MCPAATSTAMPSGYLPSVTTTLRSAPSGFSETTQSSLRSRRNRRPNVALSPDTRGGSCTRELTMCLAPNHQLQHESDTGFTAVSSNSIVKHAAEPVDVFVDRDRQQDFVRSDSRRETAPLDFTEGVDAINTVRVSAGLVASFGVVSPGGCSRCYFVL